MDRRAARARSAQVELVREGPHLILRELARITRAELSPLPLPRLIMPAHHEVTASDIVSRRIAGALAAAKERMPEDFAELLLVPGLGARTVFALAQVAEVVHGAPSRFSDPARFSMAHGGKDGHPYPVPLAVYDQTLRVLRGAVDRAKLGNDDKLAALRRLDEASRRLERDAHANYDFDAHVRVERARSPGWEGRTVFDRRRKPARGGPAEQLSFQLPKTPR